MKKLVTMMLALFFAAGISNAQTTAVASVKSNVKSVANIAGDKVLQAIKDANKGKVTLIDFWATWCGPCRAAMKQIDVLKEKYAKEGKVNFVYVTGESSPEKLWSTMIMSIAGDHYRLTKSQWSTLCSGLNMPGIPCYILLNADGTEAFNNTTTGGYPGNDAMQVEIDKALLK